MDAKVIWKGNMAFDGTGDSGLTLPIDTSPEFGGEDNGFRPMELILIGLAGCTALDVASIVRKKRQELTGLEVRVHGDRAADHPRVFTDITVEYIFTGHSLDRTAIERAVELSETKYCSAHAMLSKAAQIETIITIQEAEVL